jgi:hypothetical protein
MIMCNTFNGSMTQEQEAERKEDIEEEEEDILWGEAISATISDHDVDRCRWVELRGAQTVGNVVVDVGDAVLKVHKWTWNDIASFWNQSTINRSRIDRFSNRSINRLIDRSINR